MIQGKSQKDVAESCGRTVQDVKNAVFAARKSLLRHICLIIRDYAQERYEEEVLWLSRFIPNLKEAALPHSQPRRD